MPQKSIGYTNKGIAKRRLAFAGAIPFKGKRVRERKPTVSFHEYFWQDLLTVIGTHLGVLTHGVTAA
jgi:hypothetical protein